MDKKEINFSNLTAEQLREIKSLSTMFYIEKSPIEPKKEVFHIDCIVNAFLYFLHTNGYEIKKRKDIE